MWELLNTVSLLKSEAINEIISPKKLTKTKINCKKVKGIIFLSNFFGFLKFMTEKKPITNDEQAPKINALKPIRLAKIYLSSIAAFTSGGI